MKKFIITIFCFSALIKAHEKLALVNNTDPNYIITPHLTIQKAGVTDAKHFVTLASDHQVSRYMFCSEASEDDIKKIADSWFKTKIVAPLVFLMPSKWTFHRWMIRKTDAEKPANEHEVIGSLSIMNLDDKNILELLRKYDPEHYKNYPNLGLCLKPSEWGKGYARESLYALLSKLFVANEFKQLKGLALCINKDHERCINCVMKKNEGNARKPFVYHGEVYLPNGFTKVVPKPCTVKCFTVNREDFLQFSGIRNNN
ncbi:MAG: GNAT family N-acetyltransferase [Candidatus Dependentiae bacterium]